MSHYLIDYGCNISEANASQPVGQDGSGDKHEIKKACDPCGIFNGIHFFLLKTQLFDQPVMRNGFPLVACLRSR